MAQLAKGKLIVNEYGNGFVNVSDVLCIYIPKKDMGNAYHGEIVLVEYTFNQNGKYYGKVYGYSLKHKKFIGRVHHHYKLAVFIYCDELGGGKMVEIDTNPNPHTILEKGDWVEIEIVDDTSGASIKGKLIEKLENDVDKLVEKKYGLSNLSELYDQIHNDYDNYHHPHIDSTDLDVFTIDPPHSRDCDDAFSIQSKRNGIYNIQVHISDAAHYINPHIPNFGEIMERGNTFYGVSKNWPMIPPEFANGVCSILPGKKTRVITHEFIYDSLNKTVKFDRWYYALIESKWKLDYDSVDQMLEGSPPPTLEMLHNIRILCDAAEVVKQEVRDFVIARETKSHEMVKYWMILTNTTMCKLIGGKIYRYNPPPPSSKMNLVKSYIQYKYGVSIGGENRDELYNIYCNREKDDRLFEYLVKSMLQKAYYGVGGVSCAEGAYTEHYGMGLVNYKHSSDLLAHLYLKGYKNIPYESYITIANTQEVKQDEIELFIERCNAAHRATIGEIYCGIIIGISKTGITVYIEKFDNKYSVHISKLGNEKFQYDEICERLCGDSIAYTMFQKIDLVLTKIDIKQMFEFTIYM
jgi:ribonuclease R